MLQVVADTVRTVVPQQLKPRAEVSIHHRRRLAGLTIDAVMKFTIAALDGWLKRVRAANPGYLPNLQGDKTVKRQRLWDVRSELLRLQREMLPKEKTRTKNQQKLARVGTPAAAHSAGNAVGEPPQRYHAAAAVPQRSPPLLGRAPQGMPVPEQQQIQALEQLQVLQQQMLQMQMNMQHWQQQAKMALPQQQQHTLDGLPHELLMQPLPLPLLPLPQQVQAAASLPPLPPSQQQQQQQMAP